ncbi:unnamed protein product [Lepidochelys olivacea]
MLLIKVAGNFQQELGCDFILVIDTEGLKAPELAKLEDSYQHDNELATLVTGLSDITIVNMAMENATEMKDVLQIVVHAFLRMEKIGKKNNCQFVHQNVSDVSAHEQNMRDRKHLLEQLNEMTKVAANMEKKCKEMNFSDIMDYDLEKHNWYIPALWHGLSPMAPVNLGYSQKVYELKKYLFEFLKDCSQERTPKDIPQFLEWVRSLWNAVKHENFIFSFRNSLVDEAYNQLSVKYAEWEWVDGLLNHCRKSNCKLNNDELEKELENMWRETLSELSLIPLQRRNIFEDVEFQLRRDLADRGSAVWKMLRDAKSLCAYKTQNFKMKKEYLDLKVFRGYTLSISGVKEFLTQECWHKTEALAKSLIEECNSYTDGKVNGKADYDETYCRELF